MEEEIGRSENAIIRLFVLTPVVKKTKTQAQKSSQKLKKTTQALGGFFPKVRKLKKITQALEGFFQKLKKLKKKTLKIECFSGG